MVGKRFNNQFQNEPIRSISVSFQRARHFLDSFLIAGSMLPFILRRLDLDPASASAPFVATLVDVTGLIIYFTIASVFMRGTLL